MQYISLSFKFFKACVRYFLLNFYFSPNDRPSKTIKFFFIISYKKLFPLSRYSNYCIFTFPSFFLVTHCSRVWFKKNIRVNDVVNCLNKNLITHFVWYLDKEIRCNIETMSIDRVLDTEYFHGKIMNKICTKS